MKNFEVGKTVSIAECYLTDEASEHILTSPTAVVQSEPSDEEELICVRYESGDFDYIPQSIIELL